MAEEIYHLLGGLCPRQRLSVRAMAILTDMCLDLSVRMIREAQELMDIEECSIVVMRQVKAVCHLVLPRRLARLAWRYACAALQSYEKRQSTEECPLSQAGRAGLSLPVRVVVHMFTKYRKRIREDASVAVTAVLEFVLLEVMRATLLEAGSDRVTPRYILKALTKTDHLAAAFDYLVFPGVPFIPESEKATVPRVSTRAFRCPCGDVAAAIEVKPEPAQEGYK